MRELLILVTMLLPALAFAQDCPGKIQAARASKSAGNYRLALAQFTAAASSCGDSRRAEIEMEILGIYDKIEKLRDDALSAQNLAKTEAENARTARKITENALAEAQQANRQAKAAYDSLGVVLDNLGKANADKVLLILAEVRRNQEELDFDAAVDKLKTARILRAYPDSVNAACEGLSRALLIHAKLDLQQKTYKSAIAKIKTAELLNALPADIAVFRESLIQYLFENARLDILNANYDAASEKINDASIFPTSYNTMADAYFELAFCYIETGHVDRATGILDTLAQIQHNKEVQDLLRELPETSLWQKIQLLRQAHRQLDSQREQHLADRYFSTVFAKIPGGVFSMGSDAGDEASQGCSVTIQPFLLSAWEVTFSEYYLFCTATNRPKPADTGWGLERRPVVDISWYDAIEYCNWRSRQEGLTEAYLIDKDAEVEVICNWEANGYRLPTEAEWEFAAGNGTAHTRFSWGSTSPTAQQGGNVADETAKAYFPNLDIFPGYTDGYAYIAPVGTYPPNTFGLYDMSGNVWEWCWDWYDPHFCRTNASRKAQQISSSGVERVLRGGSWLSFPKDCQVSSRFYSKPDTRNFSIGFRLARTQKE